MTELEKKIADLTKKADYTLTRPPATDSVLANDPTFWKATDDVLTGNNVFFVGPAGTGKTVLSEAIPSALGRGFLTLNCSQWTSPGEIIGGETITGFRSGKLHKAWGEGLILILDEMPKLDPNTAGLFNDALAKTAAPKGRNSLTDPLGKEIQKHPNFGCIASGNTTGKSVSALYGGNNQQDASLLDRFSGSYYFIGFDEKKESKLVFSTVFEICKAIRDLIVANDGEDIMTLRTMLNFSRTFDLEMRRELGEMPDSKHGKTLKDCIESYLSVADEDIANLVRRDATINLTQFFNSYKNVKKYQADRARFEGK
jgi:AAA domain (dynein-related subfamily)